MITRVLLPTPYFSRHFSFKGIRRGGREGKGRRPSFQKSSWRISLPPHSPFSVDWRRALAAPESSERRFAAPTSVEGDFNASRSLRHLRGAAAAPALGARRRAKWCTGVATRCVGGNNNGGWLIFFPQSVSELQSLRKHRQRRPLSGFVPPNLKESNPVFKHSAQISTSWLKCMRYVISFDSHEFNLFGMSRGKI